MFWLHLSTLHCIWIHNGDFSPQSYFAKVKICTELQPVYQSNEPRSWPLVRCIISGYQSNSWLVLVLSHQNTSRRSSVFLFCHIRRKLEFTACTVFYKFKKPVEYHTLFLFYQIKTPLEFMVRTVFHHIKKPVEYHNLFLFYQIKTPLEFMACTVFYHLKNQSSIIPSFCFIRSKHH